ncbi:helix-turn-helix domain-containing protein [Croceimicrobium sp.]|uniref:helix-turn-helix domain-containing protein n=1 Tax=Croceimicrobium sp. TaxID=2828340 RepID=UPI003BA94A24
MAASKDPIPKICMFCQNLFEARKSTTQYCSTNCAKKAYKERKRQERNQAAQRENLEKLSAPIKTLQKRDYISVEEAAIILGVSRWTVQRAIKQGKLESAKLLGRRIISQKSFKKFFKS